MAALATLPYHAYTMFLFSKSDVKTTVIPMAVFAVSAGPMCSENRVLHTIQAVFWIWLHLLQFNLANQTRDLEEDVNNKSWRPLPAGRITLQNALILRWLSIPLCFAVSRWYSTPTLMASLLFTAIISTYHGMNGHRHWLMKSLIITGAYGCLAWGSALIAGCNRENLDPIGRLALALILAVLATTTHAQDFQDAEGDRLVGRKTFPIVSPGIARGTVMATLLAWSLYLTALWELPPQVWAIFGSLAVLTGYRYVTLRTTKEDKLSFVIYNVWLTIVCALPGYYRSYVLMQG